MQKSDRRWKFSVAVLLPVAGAVVVTLALAAGFIVWSADRTDQRALDQQRTLAAHMIDGTKLDFQYAQSGEVLRYETVDAFTGDELDMDWIDANFGFTEYDQYGHDRVYVLDPDLKPVYAAAEGESVALRAYERDRSVVDPLAIRFRDPKLAAQIASFQAGKADMPPQLFDVVTLDGKAAMVGVLPIVSDWEDQEQDPGTYYYHVAIKFLAADVAADLMDQYLLRGARFDTTSDTGPDESLVPVTNTDGRFIAWFKWQPERPGQALLHETLPASGGLLAVVALVIGLLLFFLGRSTAALEKARADALFRATHDPLTGLANRALFSERLERSALPLALLALDLDRFKAVNDTLGHEAGDELLRQVAARLTPLVGPQDLVARLGGDEFMVLVSGSTEPSELSVLAGRIVAALAEPFTLGAEMASIGVSIGIATAIKDDRRDLVSRADFALYDAKESGRNTYRVFDQLAKAA